MSARAAQITDSVIPQSLGYSCSVNLCGERAVEKESEPAGEAQRCSVPYEMFQTVWFPPLTH